MRETLWFSGAGGKAARPAVLLWAAHPAGHAHILGTSYTWDAGDVDEAALAVGKLRQARVHDVAARQRANARVQRLPLRPVVNM